MNVGSVVWLVNTATKIGTAGMWAYNIWTQFYNEFIKDEKKINSFSKRTEMALKLFKKKKWEENFEIDVMDTEMTPRKEWFYIFAFDSWYLHIEELEELWIDILGLSPNDFKMSEVAKNIYYWTQSIPEWDDENFNEWLSDNWFEYNKILLARENVKNKIANNIEFDWSKEEKAGDNKKVA